MNEEGTYIVHPASGKIVDFVPNPLQSGPAFVVAKRFSFDQMQGQFDQTIGLNVIYGKNKYYVSYCYGRCSFYRN